MSMVDNIVANEASEQADRSAAAKNETTIS